MTDLPLKHVSNTTSPLLDVIELDSRNVLLKIQIWELLSAMCVFNEEGHTTVLEALEYYKVSLLLT